MGIIDMNMSAIGLDLSSITSLGSVAMASMFALAVSYFTTKNGVKVGSNVDLTQADIAAIATGALKGTLHVDNIDTITTCVAGESQNIEPLKNELVKAIPNLVKENPNVLDILSAVTGLGKAFKDLGELAGKCESDLKDSRELQLFKAMTDNFKNATKKDIAIQTGKNLVVSGVDIYRELSAAYTNYFAAEYEQFGIDVGSALALVFIGPSGVNKLVTPEEGHNLKAMIDVYTYPTISLDILNDEDNSEYLAYLFYLEDSRAGLVEDEPELDEIVVTVPEFREITAEEIEEMIDGEWFYDSE